MPRRRNREGERDDAPARVKLTPPQLVSLFMEENLIEGESYGFSSDGAARRYLLGFHRPMRDYERDAYARTEPELAEMYLRWIRGRVTREGLATAARGGVRIARGLGEIGSSLQKGISRTYEGSQQAERETTLPWRQPSRGRPSGARRAPATRPRRRPAEEDVEGGSSFPENEFEGAFQSIMDYDPEEDQRATERAFLQGF